MALYKTDSMRSRWSFETDGDGNKTAVWPPIRASHPHRYEYDQNAQLTKYTDLDGIEITTTYDLLGRVSSNTTPDGTTSIEYVENRPWPSVVKSATGRTVKAEYDVSGNPVRVVDPTGHAIVLNFFY